MSNDPAVSAIITTYRRSDVLPRAIRSALAQTVQHIEVIVVDDEPSEAARAATLSFGDPRVRYIAHETNRGPSAARNTGIAAAIAPYIAFLDDDDEWLSHKLERQLAVAEAAERPVVVTTFELWLREDSERLRAIRLDGDVLPRLLRDDLVHMQTLLVPRRAFAEVGEFDEELFHHEDLDMALRLARRFRYVTVPEALTTIHVTPGSLSRNYDNRIRALRRLLEKTPELRGNRRLRSRWLYRLARLLAETGDRHAWQVGLRGALRTDPTNARAWVALATSAAGGPQAHLRLATARGRATRRLREVAARRGGAR